MGASTDTDRLYLDDLHVGQRFSSATHTLDETEVKEFAIKFDPQPFHTDQRAAERSFFNGLVASGWHTAALTMRLNVESIPLAGGALKGGRVIADWPGLKNANLYEGRDLAATTDLRAVLKGLLKDHLRVTDQALAGMVFPGSADVKPMAGLVG